jgi:uncharacterized protein
LRQAAEFAVPPAMMAASAFSVRLCVGRSSLQLSKIVLLILAAFCLYLLLKGFGRKSSAAKRGDAQPQTNAPELMVGCAHCGVNLPQGEALAENGVFYCDEAHRRLGKR